MRAFVFPGQGSQRVGMGRAFYDASPSLRALFDTADKALDFPLSKLMFEGPEGELQLTANTQPAILTASCAAARALDEAGIKPDVVAGHSLGEYSALVCAGALPFADAVRLVHLRGTYMQQAVAPGVGAMAAIVGLDARAVEDTCREALSGSYSELCCQPANFNGAGQVVIAGHKDAVERAMALAKDKGAKLVKALPVSAPFHCWLMRPAAERLAAELKLVTIHPLRVPVVTNVEATANHDEKRVLELLVRQVTGSVRWEESVQEMVRMGVNEFVEVGPGKVLAGLIKRVAPGAKIWNVEEPAHVEALRSA